MAIAQELQLALTTAGARSEALVQLASEKQLPLSTIITSLMKHGGVSTLLDRDLMAARLKPLFARTTTEHVFNLNRVTEFNAFVTTFSANVGAELDKFFVKLVDQPYTLTHDLVGYLTERLTGRVYTSPAEEQNPAPLESPDFPAAFTFVGQFVDHDLTLNAINLIDPEGNDVENAASPLIDLDSVYGLRSKLSKRPEAIFDATGRFRHDTATAGVIDLPRTAVSDDAEWVNSPAIFDARNDENQMILQVHLLIERLHNKFTSNGCDFATAKNNTLLNWQSFLIHEYLPHLIQPAVLTELRSKIDGGDFGALHVAKQSQTGTWYMSMPHEFSIGFRMGHSQLRPAYNIQAANPPVTLFNSDLSPDQGTFPPTYADLRGGQKLSAAHQIDWQFFLGNQRPMANAIDGKVTSVVFDLPRRTIPDDIKYVHNLAQRNLIRSSMIGLCAGEELAAFFGVAAPLTHDQVEPNADKKYLFTADGTFRTPLWYYILKEAELARTTGAGPQNPLGELGSRLVGEVILCAIRFNDINWWDQQGASGTWSVNGTPQVTLAEIAAFV
ncbi:hypothetical protein [Bradyrhizobium sp.]|uniref:hypothetical protein n=1 Tax=Bradyrhizobium sp. TaxID=376 RepID=UPI0039E24746